MFNVTMDFIEDWIKTVKEMFDSSGQTLEEGLSAEGVAELYYSQTMPAEQATAEARHTLARLRELEDTILQNLDTLIVPDIRQRTSYAGDDFHFSWVYYQGEHIIELKSEYRIPLTSE